MSSANAPIGIFDSGFGGLTVARAIVDLLPHEDIIYLGDTARAPYGPRPIAEVREFALQALDRLVDEGVKMLVIACNTASAAVLRDARERYDVPIVDVVLPAARAAVTSTRNGKVGVICTQATATTRAYDDALSATAGVTLTTQVCPRFVPLVEAGVTGGPELLGVAREYLASVQDVGIDTLILGCTHYPLLAGAISYVMGPEVVLVSSSNACAEQAYRELTDAGLAVEGPREATRRFWTTGDAGRFAGIAQRLMGTFVQDVGELRLG